MSTTSTRRRIVQRRLLGLHLGSVRVRAALWRWQVALARTFVDTLVAGAGAENAAAGLVWRSFDVPRLRDTMSTSPVPNGAPLVPHHEIEHVFRRAAELQAQAEQIASLALTQTGASAPVARHGWTAAEVVAMAREAGIAQEFVEQAIREGLHPSHPESPSADAHQVPGLEATRMVEASVSDAFTAVRETAEATPWRLQLIDAVRTPGGGLRISLDPTQHLTTESGGLAPFANGMMAAGINFERIELDIEAAGAGSSMITVRAVPARTLVKLYSRITGAAIGGVGGVAGWVTGALALGLGGWALVPLTALGALAGAGAGIRGFQASVRHTVRKDADGIQKLLGAIAARIHTQSFAAGSVEAGTSNASLPPA